MATGRITVTTAPASEPVDTTLAKEWLRIDSGDTSQDGVIDVLITACRRRVEEYLRAALITQTLTWQMSSDEMKHPIWLPRVPAQSITSLTYYDTDGNGTAETATNYELVGRTKVVTRNDGWSVLRKHRAGTMVYVAGYGDDADDVPQDIRLAILRLMADYFEFREGILAGTTAVELPEGVKNLLEPYRWDYL